MMVRTFNDTCVPVAGFFLAQGDAFAYNCLEQHPPRLSTMRTMGGYFLGHLNYYRHGAYWLPFEADHASHAFKPGTRFADVLNLYNTLTVLAWLLDCICPQHHWRQRLKTLLAQHTIDLQRMGFPAGWEQMAIWQENTP